MPKMSSNVHRNRNFLSFKSMIGRIKLSLEPSASLTRTETRCLLKQCFQPLRDFIETKDISIIVEKRSCLRLITKSRTMNFGLFLRIVGNFVLVMELCGVAYFLFTSAIRHDRKKSISTHKIMNCSALEMDETAINI